MVVWSHIIEIRQASFGFARKKELISIVISTLNKSKPSADTEKAAEGCLKLLGLED
jgi:hypothetical protein